MAIIYQINLDQTARHAIDQTRYVHCSFDLIRQNFLAAQIVDRFSSWLAQRDEAREPFSVRKDPPLVLHWHQRGSAATAVLESGKLIASVFLLLSGMEPRDELSAAVQFQALLAGAPERLASASGLDVRRFDRRPLLLTVTDTEFGRSATDLDLLRMCIAGAFFERLGAA
ncbi:MAG TPA: hypothetical protein VHY37_10410 [Tepidisphaeraceae bacterium]|jgi:hypothetical protein|nr:hypothetical protein [Tepidisphaeraceae bacterium]